MAVNLHFVRYIGNGVARSFSGFGFGPTMAWTWGGQLGRLVFRISEFGANESSTLVSGSEGNLFTTGITSLGADDVSIGTHSNVNFNNPAYIYYLCGFFGADLVHGTYTGDGGASRAISGLGFAPAWACVKRTSNNNPATVGDPTYRHQDMPAGESIHSTAGQAILTNGILSLDADGFTVGNNGEVNANLETYAYFAFRETANVVALGSYGGNAANDREIAVGFQPRLVFMLVVDNTNLSWWAYFKYDNMPGVHSAQVEGASGGGVDDLFTIGVRDFTGNGFKVGATVGDDLNLSGWTYYWMAIGGGAAARSYSIVY